MLKHYICRVLKKQQRTMKKSVANQILKGYKSKLENKTLTVREVLLRLQGSSFNLQDDFSPVKYDADSFTLEITIRGKSFYFHG